MNEKVDQQQSDTHNNSIISKYLKSVFAQITDETFDRQKRHDERYDVSNDQQIDLVVRQYKSVFIIIVAFFDRRAQHCRNRQKEREFRRRRTRKFLRHSAYDTCAASRNARNHRQTLEQTDFQTFQISDFGIFGIAEPIVNFQ